MNNFSGMLRQFLARLTASLRNFMAGRYGMDRLNMVILWAGVAASLLSALIRVSPFNLIFWALSYVLMFLSIFRMLSRNTYKRFAFPKERERSPSPAPAAGKNLSERPEDFNL